MTAGTGFDSRRLGIPSRLAVVCVLATGLEAVALLLVGGGNARWMAPQVMALGPLGVFHDLRWLLVYSYSWLTFGVTVAVWVAARGTVFASVLRLAWPHDSPRPAMLPSVLSGCVFTLIAAILLSPAAALLFGVAVVPFSWPYLTAVGTVLLVAFVLSHGAVNREWWRRLPSPAVLGWMLASVVVLTLVSAAMLAAPPAFAPIIAAAGGLFDALAWTRVTAALAHRRPVRRRLPLAPAVSVGLLLAAIGGARLGFLVHGSHQTGRPGPPSGTAAGERAVLVVAGFGSSCCAKGRVLAARARGFAVEQFSYAGSDSRGHPLPHPSAATNVALPVLASRMATQVSSLAARTGHKVTIVAESEGSLVTMDYLAENPDAPVDTMVLLSPIIEPRRVSFPAPGEDGTGLVGGWGLRSIVQVVRAISPFQVSADNALLRSINDSASHLRWPLSCRSGLHVLAFVPLADAVTLPLPSSETLPTVVVPAFHGGMLGRDDINRDIVDYLTRGRLRQRGVPPAMTSLITFGAATWRVPSPTFPPAHASSALAGIAPSAAREGAYCQGLSRGGR